MTKGQDYFHGELKLDRRVEEEGDPGGKLLIGGEEHTGQWNAGKGFEGEGGVAEIQRFSTQLQTVAAKRALVTKVGAKATGVLTETLAKKYKDRKGGFLRIIKSKRRLSDGSKMAIIEFV